ncbi:hypothetical protein DY218_29865 [Streptomyces triticagri]|uniref:DUF8175 domain-containing protein n=1 Tax=Streptomyces triticagri TaxID=2293568 RepID=A0A372LWJ4_9ACTN|nr:hypothetical protein [Streptomyces triticagri]RFU83034.1 hypothetical protein DY218_29865 [Streptomyces triticagri]
MSLGDEHGGRSDDGFGDDARIGYGGTGQTRTRLPERDDPYGGARRPPRSSRSLVTVVAVVVLLVAAIAFANRGGGEDEGSGESGGGKPGAAPTAASGEKPVEGKDGGIPSGFAHSRQGAESAAANYSVALGAEGMYKKDQRPGIVNAVYAPDVVADRESALDKVYSDPKFLASIGLNKDGSAPQGQTFVTRFSPVGSKVEKYSAETATVSVWYSALFGLAGEGSENPVSESWYTSTYQLKWVGGDWKVVDFKQKDGPVPVGRDQAASSAKDMADAVKKFGGFTYAR